MPFIHAARARLPGGWRRDLKVEVDGLRIGAITQGPAEPGDDRVDVLLPAPSNLHSHGFQRAMAGRTEVRATGEDSFWTWREVMYRFVDRLTPDQVEAITAMAFCEMQQAGYAAVGEFHYLHHQTGGMTYETLSELSERIISAASDTGIGLTLLPVFYRYGGTGRRPLEGGQLRFGCDTGVFATLLEGARQAARRLPEDTRIGLGLHSLRALGPEDLPEVLPLAEGGPIHIHAAEQAREVTEIEGWLGARPVEWLLENAPIGPDWCIVHATHMTPDETRALAATGAVAGLCPITEANLGDGVFPGQAWQAAGGAFGVGSDSNVRISLWEELRMLEYAQRLHHRARNVLAPKGGHTGAALYMAAAQGAARATGRTAGRIEAGYLADLVAVDADHPALLALEGDALLDGLVFAAGDGVVTDVWSAGRHCVRAGRHVARERIARRFARAMSELLDD